MKATDLEQVVRNFDPRKALSGEALHSWFVARENSPRGRMKTVLRVQHEPQKILLVGHRGSGKSTELNKLAEEVAAQFQVISLDVLTITGRTNLEYEDLMLALSTKVTRECIERHLLDRPPGRAGTEGPRGPARLVAAGGVGTRDPANEPRGRR